MIRELPKDHADLVKDIAPSQISITGIQRVLQSLLAERVSIRDLAAILEAIAEIAAATRDTRQIAEHVRVRLARQISAQHQSPAGYIPMIAMSPHWEDAFATSLVGDGESKQLAMQPSKLSDFVMQVRDRFEQAARTGEMPILVTSQAMRPHVRAIVERCRPSTPVIGQAEIFSRMKLKTVASL